MNPSRVGYCENSIERLLAKLEEELPLRFREIFVDAREVGGVAIEVCEDDHVHFTYGLQDTPMAVYNAGLVMAYTVALALDTGVHAEDSLTRKAMDEATAKVHKVLVEVNVHYANGFRASARMLEGLLRFHGEGVAERPKPVSEEEIQEGLSASAMMRAAFGYTLEGGPGGWSNKDNN